MNDLLLELLLISSLLSVDGERRIGSPETCLNSTLLNPERFVCTPSGQLICLNGWGGDLCDRPPCSDCSDHGDCVQPKKCRCLVGYFGEKCEICIKLPGCHHGTCQKAFECNCNIGWTGSHCSQPICKEGCSRIHGSCENPGECICGPGMTGPTCTECIRAPGCVHGYCEGPFQCVCEPGWTGQHCDQPSCPSGCVHGHCRSPGFCECYVGYSGVACEHCIPYPGCQQGSCSHPWQCSCYEGWSGYLCDKAEGEGVAANNTEVNQWHSSVEEQPTGGSMEDPAPHRDYRITPSVALNRILPLRHNPEHIDTEKNKSVPQFNSGQDNTDMHIDGYDAQSVDTSPEQYFGFSGETGTYSSHEPTEFAEIVQGYHPQFGAKEQSHNLAIGQPLERSSFILPGSGWKNPPVAGSNEVMYEVDGDREDTSVVFNSLEEMVVEGFTLFPPGEGDEWMGL